MVSALDPATLPDPTDRDPSAEGEFDDFEGDDDDADPDAHDKWIAEVTAAVDAGLSAEEG